MPGGCGQPKVRLLLPRNLGHLKGVIRVVEDRPAKEETQGDVTAVQGAEIPGSCKAEVESAMHRQVRRAGAGERRHDRGEVRPRHRAQSLSPAVRRAEE